MANLEFCDTHNMVAYLLKIEGSEDTRDVQITTTIDGKVKLVSEESIRMHLKLEDSDDEAASTGVDVKHERAATTVSSLDAGHGSCNIDKTPSMAHDSPLLRVNTLRSDEGSMTLNELTILCTKLSQKVESLEADLKQTKKVYGAAYTKLIMMVKKLKKPVKSIQVRRRSKIVVSDDEELEYPSKQGRSMIEEIDQDAEVHLVTPTQVLVEVAKVHTYTRGRRTISTATGGISIAKESISTTGASMPVSTVGMVDKGKAIMQESKPELTTTKLQQRQERAGYEAAEPREKDDDELTQEDLQQMMMMVLVEEVYVEALQSLVKERFSTTKPTNDKEKELWVELKRLFEPDVDDTLWKLQKYMHDP
nr:hypothetical protein [Tanacetum cinerariifolium]